MSYASFGSFLLTLLAGAAAQAEPRLWSITQGHHAVVARVALDPDADPPRPAQLSLAADGGARVVARSLQRVMEGPSQLIVLTTDGLAPADLSAIASPRVTDQRRDSLLHGLGRIAAEPDGPGRRVLLIVTNGVDVAATDELAAEAAALRARGVEIVLVAHPPPDAAAAERQRALADLATTASDSDRAARALGATYDVELRYDPALPEDGRPHAFVLRVGATASNPLVAVLPPLHEPGLVLQIAEQICVGIVQLVPPLGLLLLVVSIVRGLRRPAPPRPSFGAEVLPPRTHPGHGALRIAAAAALVLAVGDVVWLTARTDSTLHLAILLGATGLWRLRRRRGGTSARLGQLSS
jgi:hypothetical protein